MLNILLHILSLGWGERRNQYRLNIFISVVILPLFPDIYISGSSFAFSLLLEDFLQATRKSRSFRLQSLTAESVIILSYNVILTGAIQMFLQFKRKINHLDKVHAFYDRLSPDV